MEILIKSSNEFSLLLHKAFRSPLLFYFPCLHIACFLSLKVNEYSSLAPLCAALFPWCRDLHGVLFCFFNFFSIFHRLSYFLVYTFMVYKIYVRGYVRPCEDKFID